MLENGEREGMNVVSAKGICRESAEAGNSMLPCGGCSANLDRSAVLPVTYPNN